MQLYQVSSTGSEHFYPPNTHLSVNKGSGPQVAYVRANSKISQMVPTILSQERNYALSAWIGYRADRSARPDGRITVTSSTSQTVLLTQEIEGDSLIQGVFRQFEMAIPVSATVEGEGLTITLEILDEQGQINFDLVELTIQA